MRLHAVFTVLAVLVFGLSLAGCSTGMQNITYQRGWGDVERFERPVVAAVIPSVDQRSEAGTYPKLVIKNINYSGEVSYDINDRTLTDVVDEALYQELGQHGVSVVMVKDAGTPLNKSTYQDVEAYLKGNKPDVQAALSYEIVEFMATSRRNVLTYDIKISARVRLYALNVNDGKLITQEYNTEWTDWTFTQDRDYMIGQLDKALLEVMKNTVRDNPSLKRLLISASKG